jgi:hypothetical protein
MPKREKTFSKRELKMLKELFVSFERKKRILEKPKTMK